MKPSKFFTFIAVAAVVVFTAMRAHLALEASLPSDMPKSARFVQTGTNIADSEPQGQWVACRPSLDKEADWCRVTDQKGTVVYEGQFLPANSDQPVMGKDLSVGKLTESKLWVHDPTTALPVPVIPLKDGQVLVPTDNRPALIERWEKHPDESAKYLRQE